MTELPKIEDLLKLVEQNKKLHQLIRTTIPTLHGWCTIEKANTLAGIVLHIKPTTCTEIGVWGGRSLLPMAWAAKEVGNCRVVGIDPYDAQVSSEEEYGVNAEWWGKQDHGMIERSFLELVARFKLGDVVEFIKKKSDDVTPMQCQLLHIDGGHTEVAVRDAERFGPRVSVGGVAVLDDRMWVGGSVLRAIDVLTQLGFREVYINHEQNWSVMVREHA